MTRRAEDDQIEHRQRHEIAETRDDTLCNVRIDASRVEALDRPVGDRHDQQHERR